jgi:PAS domain S-box-containing protein
LELLADDVPLAGVLEAIVRGMEELDQTMLCSILLLDSEGRHLGNGIAPSLPDYYNAAIEGLEIGMGVGSCGTAAFTGERVIVDDIASHPYWASFKELAARADLGACWSQPFISSSNKALGTFAIYHHEARSPDEHEIKIIEQAAYLASIAIDKSIVSKALQTSEQRFRSFVENANDLIYLLSPEGIITYVAPNVEQLLGYQSDELTGTSFTPLIHVDELPACILFLQQLFESGRKMSGLEYRIRHKNGSWLWFVSNASPVRDPVTEEMSFSAIGHDITERKLMEKELCHKQMLLEDMNRVLKEHLVSEQQKSFELADLIKRLQNSEELYHSLVETSQDLIWRCDAEGKYTYLNLAWEHIFGYELDEMLGKEHCDFQTAEEAERYRKEFHRLLHGESIEQFETTFTGKSGNAIHLVFNALYVMDEQDEFAGASGTAHDITLRKQMENSLHESEEKHRILLEESGDAIFALTAEGRYTFVNRVFSEGLGKLTDEIIGKTLWDVFSKEEAEKRFSALSSVFRTGEAASLEVCIPHADGASYHLTTINPIRGINGEIYAAICSSKNVTELKNTEKRLSEITNRVMEQSMELKQFNELLEQRIFERTQELQASQSRIDQLCEQSGTMIWEVDGQGLYTYVNHVSKAVFGYSPEEMIGQMHFYDVFPESEQEAIKQLVAPVFENKAQIHNLENKTITKDGRQLFWTTTGIPMLGDDGTLLGYRGSDTDITESKKIKEQLIQSQKMEAVGQLAGGLAHDFNNVLSIINGYCCLMQMEMEHDETQKGYLGKIMEASGRAGELTHSMLAFSRTQVMHPQNQDLNWIVSKTGAFIDKIIGDNINFKTVIKEATLPVYADGGQIEQILINLSNNARDAMPNGGDLEIATHSVSMDDSFISAHGFGKPGRYAVITVSDSGTGMDAATRKKIFEPFFTTKAVDKGTGLGLAMVYGITKQHKGFVEVSSEPGQGARFMIYLPIVKTETVASDVKTAAGLSTSAGTETILVADDNTDVREFMSKILKSLGYQVILAVDGQDAVDKFADNSDKIHLIIMDMIMPLKSGKQAYDEIRQIKPEAMALFSSGYSANIIQQQGELGKNAEFISKPVQPTELMKKVREMLDRSF